MSVNAATTVSTAPVSISVRSSSRLSIGERRKGAGASRLPSPLRSYACLTGGNADAHGGGAGGGSRTLTPPRGQLILSQPRIANFATPARRRIPLHVRPLG